MRVLLALALAAAGVATAVAAVAVHPRWWGLALAVVAVLGTLVTLPPGWTTRLPYGVGFGGGIGRLAVPRPEGDVVIGGDAAGYAVLLLGLVVTVVSVATLPRPGSARRREQVGGPTYTDPR